MDFEIETMPKTDDKEEQTYDLIFKNDKLLNRATLTQVLEKIKMVVEAMVKPVAEDKKEKK